MKPKKTGATVDEVSWEFTYRRLNSDATLRLLNLGSVVEPLTRLKDVFKPLTEFHLKLTANQTVKLTKFGFSVNFL